MFLSALLRSSGPLRNVIQQKPGQCLALLYAARPSSSVTPTPPQAPDTPAEGKSKTATLIANWDKANAMFFGPDRDTKNFPHPVQPDEMAKVRMKFIPEEWFTLMYPKTGVTGPYVFGFGLVAYLLSKEIWVVDHGFAEFIMFCGAVWVTAKYIWTPHIMPSINDTVKEAKDYQYNIPLQNAKKIYDAQIEHCDKEIHKMGAQKFINESKRENVDLQLEAEYRSRLQQIYSTVKNRLDYVLEKETSEKKMEQDHMVEWIVNSVRKGITPEQEKGSISKCIQDLQGLAKTHGAVLT